MYGIFCYLGVSIVASAARTFFRIRRLDIDSGFLALALITLCASAGVFHAASSLLYLQVRFSVGHPIPMTPDFLDQLEYYHRMENAALVLLWTSIFAVKFSFLFFFRHLTK